MLESDPATQVTKFYFPINHSSLIYQRLYCFSFSTHLANILKTVSFIMYTFKNQNWQMNFILSLSTSGLLKTQQ